MRVLDKRTTDYLEFVGPLNVWRPTMISLEARQDYIAIFGSIDLDKLMMITYYNVDEDTTNILNDIFDFKFVRDEADPIMDVDFVPKAKYLMMVTLKGQP